MSIWVLITILLTIAFLTGVYIWVVLKRSSPKHTTKEPRNEILEEAEKDIESIFNNEFREELRNRGRLHFEKIIGENAMFLQQDLRLTTSQLNEYMKSEITNKLQEEFAKYEQSITDAKQMALDSISKTQEAIEEQRQAMSTQLTQEIEREKQVMLSRFENNMADIVNHYVLMAIGNQIDLNDQLEFILSDLQDNREAIIKDLQSGA